MSDANNGQQSKLTNDELGLDSDVENEEELHERAHRLRRHQRRHEQDPQRSQRPCRHYKSTNSVQTDTSGQAEQPRQQGHNNKSHHHHHHSHHQHHSHQHGAASATGSQHSHQHHHHHHQHHHHHLNERTHHQTRRDPDGHLKQYIKPDPTIKEKARTIRISRAPAPRSQTAGRSGIPIGEPGSTEPPSSRVETVVDEEQLQRRLVEASKSANASQGSSSVKASGIVSTTNGTNSVQPDTQTARAGSSNPNGRATSGAPEAPTSNPPAQTAAQCSNAGPRSTSSSHSSSHSSSSSSSGGRSSWLIAGRPPGPDKSPPPAAIIIPPSVAKTLSNRSTSRTSRSASDNSAAEKSSSLNLSAQRGPSSTSPITREQLQYGPVLQRGEVQVLYQNPNFDSDRNQEQARMVAPNLNQSPVALMSVNPTYEPLARPLVVEYPPTIENLRLNNTGFSWEVKIPCQVSLRTCVYGAQLGPMQRFRLDQFHCHWGSDDQLGSEHTVDGRYYSAELHFVHYNMEKYHSLSKAIRQPDGILVIAVFLDARDEHRPHAELEKVASQLKSIPLKGEHAIIKQATRVENLLPQNRSYWSYQGSLTTPPYYESVTWFVMKTPIRCSRSQIQRFRELRSSVRLERPLGSNNNEREPGQDSETLIRSNHRKTQPLNGRPVLTYDEIHHHRNHNNSNYHHHQSSSSSSSLTLGSSGSNKAN